jgi:hypothetical protein
MLHKPPGTVAHGDGGSGKRETIAVAQHGLVRVPLLINPDRQLETLLEARFEQSTRNEHVILGLCIARRGQSILHLENNLDKKKELQDKTIDKLQY